MRNNCFRLKDINGIIKNLDCFIYLFIIFIIIIILISVGIHSRRLSKLQFVKIQQYNITLVYGYAQVAERKHRCRFLNA